MTTLTLAVGLVLGWLLLGMFAASLLYCWANPVEHDEDTPAQTKGEG